MGMTGWVLFCAYVDWFNDMPRFGYLQPPMNIHSNKIKTFRCDICLTTHVLEEEDGRLRRTESTA